MSDDTPDLRSNDGDLRQTLNLETGKISWQELQRHFAHGVVIVVGGQLDLIEVAVKLSEDDKQQLEAWLKDVQIWRARDDDARQWHDAKTEFWSVVVAPWVLVQVISE